ncbi:Glycosyl transferase, family 2 [Candidatus Sulfopaludibacter sp. SbA4]|nr:Glycosyl transferase, family 2 [Candidatus Sulfopaludibacter sp. SbA4]
MSDVGIVIVTYNSEREIGGSLDAALRTGADVVVVDNASSDGTLTEIARRGAEIARRGVQLIANPANRGFAAAANQGFAVLTSPYILLLNPDSVLVSGLEALRAACDLPGAAAAGGRLLDGGGNPQIGFMVRRFPTAVTLISEVLGLNRIWPNSPANRRYRALDLDYSKLQEVEQPAGALLMVRREVWHELGGFDEGFFPLWFEDVDFCRRLADRGYRLYYAPQAVAKHTGGHSISNLTVEMRRVYWYGSLLRYATRHFRPLAFRAVCLAVVAGSFPRAIVESASGRSLKPMAAYGKVVRLASRCFLGGWGSGLV